MLRGCLALLIAGCYRPGVEPACSVTCNGLDSCPGGLTCGADGLCFGADGPCNGAGNDGGSGPRRIRLTIAAGRVEEALDDFPVYVDLDDPDLAVRLSTDAMSFVASGLPLDYEIQSLDNGHLQAWVRLPAIAPNADTSFELDYGDHSVASAANPVGVFRNGFLAVWHFEQAAGATVVDSVGANPGTPMNFAPIHSSGQLGSGLTFSGAQTIAISNPIMGAGPSTISAWVLQAPSSDDNIVVSLDSEGGNVADASRTLYSNHSNSVAGDLGLDADIPGVALSTTGWTLVHWTYTTQVTRLYLNASSLGTFVHDAPAATTGQTAEIGGAGTGYALPCQLHAVLDEVRISNVARDPGWIAAEYANQSAPAMFVTEFASEPLP